MVKAGAGVIASAAYVSVVHKLVNMRAVKASTKREFFLDECIVVIPPEEFGTAARDGIIAKYPLSAWRASADSANLCC